ncbi:MAG: hypothetical protein Q7L19_04170 [Pseudohongiella sp.]|nr:hypothetical protein [Pseudohongiella sp.]
MGTIGKSDCDDKMGWPYAYQQLPDLIDHKNKPVIIRYMKTNKWQSKRVNTCVVTIVFALVLAAGKTCASDTMLAKRFPELHNYFNSFEVIHAAVFEEIVQTNTSPMSNIGKVQLRESLTELAKDRGSHYHTAGEHLAMLGPFRVFESRATPGLLAMSSIYYEDQVAEQAIALSGVLPPNAVATLKRGRDFQARLIEIYLNDEISNRKMAVDDAVAEYLANPEHSVPALPKSSDLLSKHPYAYAFRVGFPQLSGLTWASQWLHLAALEVVTSSADNPILMDERISRVVDVYVEKIARQHSSLMSLPSDIPTVPVIAPNLYSYHPQAAIIIDNLSVLRIVLADILAHPDVEDSDATIEAVLARFTDRSADLDSEIDYLTFVLRGGIYNQGGPALGGLTGNERNRSREALESPHVGHVPGANF